jgi:hypothetical protein
MRRLSDRPMTSGERSRRQREREHAEHDAMRAALESVLQCRSLAQARSAARDALAAVPANAKRERV